MCSVSKKRLAIQHHGLGIDLVGVDVEVVLRVELEEILQHLDDARLKLIPVESTATNDGHVELTVTRPRDPRDLLEPIGQRTAVVAVIRDDNQAALAGSALDLTSGVVDTHPLHRGGKFARVDNDLHGAPWVGL